MTSHVYRKQILPPPLVLGTLTPNTPRCGPTIQRGDLIVFLKSFPFNCIKQIADPDGRYLLLVGSIQDVEVTIMTYYAPNSNPGPFLSYVCSLLTSHQKGTLLLAGDSNVALDQVLDKYPSERVATSSAAKPFSHSLCSHDPVDLWREFHPLGKDYTYYSHPHHSHSRIDHMLMLRKHLPLIDSVSILAAPWTDHDPLLVVCRSLVHNPRHSSWIMNDSLLSIPDIREDLLKASVEYFCLNYTSVSSPVTLWGAYEAVLRGHIIQIASKRKKERQKLQITLEFRLK